MFHGRDGRIILKYCYIEIRVHLMKVLFLSFRSCLQSCFYRNAKAADRLCMDVYNVGDVRVDNGGGRWRRESVVVTPRPRELIDRSGWRESECREEKRRSVFGSIVFQSRDEIGAQTACRPWWNLPSRPSRWKLRMETRGVRWTKSGKWLNCPYTGGQFYRPHDL